MKVKLEKMIYDRVILEEQVLEIEGMTLLTGPSGVGKTTALKQLVHNYNCGYVSQNPDNQLVCDKVWHELAFGLENLGLPSNVIRSRVAEVATYLGIASWINKDVSELSGGQKQKVCLAAVLCLSPELVLLDEPTSMLDPISAREFWDIVARLSRDNNISFLIVEHNDFYVSSLCKRTLLLKDGIISDVSLSSPKISLPKNSFKNDLLTLHNIRKSYGENLVLNIPKITLSKGINCFIGPNGTGKTTLLRAITGGFKEKPLIKNSVLMPQDVKIMFSKETVKDELGDMQIPDLLKPHLLKHPLDLSGGEQHILGTFITLNRVADLYCFDEPTKGMDKKTKNIIMSIIKNSRKNVIVVSHDLDIVAEFGNKVFFLFNREIASEGTPYEVFKDNLFYKPEGVLW